MTSLEIYFMALLSAPALTEDQAAQLAIEASHTLERARSDRAAASAGKDLTEVGLLPSLSVSASYQRLDGFEDGQIGQGGQAFTIEIPRDRFNAEVSVSYSVIGVLVGRLGQLEAADHELAAARLMEAGAEADARLEGKARFHQYLGAVRSASVAQSSLELAEARLARIQAREMAGRATRADLAGARARRAERWAELVEARGRAQRAGELLRIYLGLDAVPAALPPAGWDTPRPPAEAASVDGLVEEIRTGRPALEALRRRAASSRAQAGAAWASILPDLRLSFSYLYANPNPYVIPPETEFQDAWTAGAQLVWSLDDALAGGAQRSQLEAAARGVEAEAEAQLRRLNEALRGTLIELDSVAAVHEASEVRVEAAAERLDAARAAYDAGRLTLDGLLDADLELRRARLSVVDAVVRHHLARARLERILAH